jgi:hypothetical protein
VDDLTEEDIEDGYCDGTLPCAQCMEVMIANAPRRHMEEACAIYDAQFRDGGKKKPN